MRTGHGRHDFSSKSVLLLIFGLLAASIPPVWGAANPVKNLALASMGTRARSWEPSVHVVAGHEPARAIDGSLHTYWAVAAADLPADLGLEWPEPQTLSSVVVRYFDGRMVRGPAIARTQQWGRLQYWDKGDWADIDAQVLGKKPPPCVIPFRLSPPLVYAFCLQSLQTRSRAAPRMIWEFTCANWKPIVKLRSSL